MDPTITTSEPAGLTPPDQGPIEFKSREREEDRTTRKPMVLWDRVKILLLLIGLWWFFVLAALGDNPILSFDDAVNAEVKAKWWILALIGIETIRQVHYALSERSARYHGFWTKQFAGFDDRAGRLDDWTRYRIARVLKWALVIVVIDLIVARLTDTSPILAVAQIPAQLFSALPFIFQLAFAFFFIVFQFVGLFWFLSRGGVDVYFPDDIKTRFTDVWGQDAVLEKIKENIVFLEGPEAIEQRGGYVPGGILLWGPPGTGKTLMAEAVAGETGKPYVFVDPGAFTAMFMGIGVLKVKSLFRKLRKLAVRYGGVIVFFDEADSLGNRGQLSGGGFGQGFSPPPDTASCHGSAYLSAAGNELLFRQLLGGPGPESGRRDAFMMGGMGGGGGDTGTLQALLAELSGLKKPRGFFNRVVRRSLGMRPKPPPKYRMLVMMATNMPQALDEALLRPGRLDRIYKVGYPSKAGRVRTYEGYLAKVSHELTPDQVDKMATITPYATGASIKDLINEALINAIRAGRPIITWEDMIKAKHLKELGPPEDVEYIERERHAIAVHEACHAVAAYRVRQHLTIDIATIEKGGSYLGMVASIPPEDQFSRWRSEYEADIMVSIASLAGERLFFEGDNTSGVSADLENATHFATMMEGYWGMGSTIACHGVTQKVGIGGGGKPGAGKEQPEKDLLNTGLGERIEDNLVELMRRTERLLEENRTQILALAHALETYKTIPGEDVHAVIEGRPGPLVDGTPYGRPEFAQIAEDYHARVLMAHKGHGRVDVPLPLLNGQRAARTAADDLGDPTKPVDVTEEELAGQWARPSGSPPDGETNGDAPSGSSGSSG